MASSSNPNPPQPSALRGLELGGHERAALSWLWSTNGDQILQGQTGLRALGLRSRVRPTGSTSTSMDWIDLDGHDVIKRFFVSKGFKQVTPNEDWI